MITPKYGKREAKKLIPEVPRTPRQQRMAEKLSVSANIRLRNDRMIIPPMLIERLGAALNGGTCRIIWDERAGSIHMFLSLNVRFEEIESSHTIFEICFQSGVPWRQLKLKSWRAEKQELALTTDFPQAAETLKEGVEMFFSAESKPKEPGTWSTRIVSAKAARYF